MRKKVAIITNIPAPYRIALFEHINNTYPEYEIHIIYCSENEDNRNWKVELNKNSYFLNSKTIKFRKKNNIKYIHVPSGVNKLLNKLRPDVIVGSEYSPSIIMALTWCKIHDIPFISWTDGTLHSERDINFFQKISRKIIIKNARQYIASSTKSKEAQIKYGAPENKIQISYLTVDIEKYLQNSSNLVGENNLLFVGQLVHRKGIDVLLNALSKVNNQKYHLTIVGVGPEESNIKKQINHLYLNDNISLVGYKNSEELKKYYANSKCLILPTREDCFGLVILEAMCSSLPVLASNFADGAYDLIEDEITGYIFNLNELDDLTSKIEYILANPKEAKKMGNSGYKRTELFKFEQVSPMFIEAIKNCL